MPIFFYSTHFLKFLKQSKAQTKVQAEVLAAVLAVAQAGANNKHVIVTTLNCLFR